jgi:hypothetical protein
MPLVLTKNRCLIKLCPNCRPVNSSCPSLSLSGSPPAWPVQCQVKLQIILPWGTKSPVGLPDFPGQVTRHGYSGIVFSADVFQNTF